LKEKWLQRGLKKWLNMLMFIIKDNNR
jgi:hypothetical protein